MDPKKHFEVINFILGHFVNFLEEIYQENVLDVTGFRQNSVIDFPGFCFKHIVFFPDSHAEKHTFFP